MSRAAGRGAGGRDHDPPAPTSRGRDHGRGLPPRRARAPAPGHHHHHHHHAERSAPGPHAYTGSVTGSRGGSRPAASSGTATASASASAPSSSAACQAGRGTRLRSLTSTAVTSASRWGLDKGSARTVPDDSTRQDGRRRSVSQPQQPRGHEKAALAGKRAPTPASTVAASTAAPTTAPTATATATSSSGGRARGRPRASTPAAPARSDSAPASASASEPSRTGANANPISNSSSNSTTRKAKTGTVTPPQPAAGTEPVATSRARGSSVPTAKPVDNRGNNRRLGTPTPTAGTTAKHTTTKQPQHKAPPHQQLPQQQKQENGPQEAGAPASASSSQSSRSGSNTAPRPRRGRASKRAAQTAAKRKAKHRPSGSTTHNTASASSGRAQRHRNNPAAPAAPAGTSAATTAATITTTTTSKSSGGGGGGGGGGGASASKPRRRHRASTGGSAHQVPSGSTGSQGGGSTAGAAASTRARDARASSTALVFSVTMDSVLVYLRELLTTSLCVLAAFMAMCMGTLGVVVRVRVCVGVLFVGLVVCMYACAMLRPVVYVDSHFVAWLHHVCGSTASSGSSIGTRGTLPRQPHLVRLWVSVHVPSPGFGHHSLGSPLGSHLPVVRLSGRALCHPGSGLCGDVRTGCAPSPVSVGRVVPPQLLARFVRYVPCPVMSACVVCGGDACLHVLVVPAPRRRTPGGCIFRVSSEDSRLPECGLHVGACRAGVYAHFRVHRIVSYRIVSYRCHVRTCNGVHSFVVASTSQIFFAVFLSHYTVLRWTQLLVALGSLSTIVRAPSDGRVCCCPVTELTCAMVVNMNMQAPRREHNLGAPTSKAPRQTRNRFSTRHVASSKSEVAVPSQGGDAIMAASGKAFR